MIALVISLGGNARAQVPTAVSSFTRKTPPSSARPRLDDSSRVLQRREQDELRRQDIASALGQMGLAVRWQEWSYAQMVDWRDRIQAAEALKTQHGVDVDWRMQSLASLTDMRLRAAKASELAALYGLHVDWRRYSWVGLQAILRQVGRVSQPVSTSLPHDDGLARPGRIRGSRGAAFRSQDPDAILQPTFAFNTTAVWAHPVGQRRRHRDADAILVPTFVTVPTPVLGPDDIIDPWPRRPRPFSP